MSEIRTDLNVLILSNVGDSYSVASMLAAAGVNVVMFTVVDEARGAPDDNNVYHAESWRPFIKHDFPDLVIYDDINLYHKWITALHDRKGVPILYLDTGTERSVINKAVREVPVTVLASIIREASGLPVRWWNKWRRGNKSA